MTPFPARRLAMLALAIASLATGCAQPGPLASRRTMMGSLKANVVTLESENDQLRRQVATLKSESLRMEDQLVQEKAHSDDLATRLDNAKHLLSQNGGIDREVSSRRDLDPPSNARALIDDSDTIPPPRPKRSSRTTRKPPAASIPGRIEADTPPASDERLWEPQARYDKGEQWLPIARGAGSSRVK